MNTAHWQQEILKPAVDASGLGGGPEKKAAGTVVRPPKEQPHPCPRCKSTNTKFCYYNNYSLTQPRYFCKGCRRYWTEGGSLRNIPVGGCSKKNKRSPASSTADSRGVGAKMSFVLSPLQNTSFMIHPAESTSQSLNVAFPKYHQNYRSISDFVHMSKTSSQTTALDLINGTTSSGLGVGFGGGTFSNSYIPISDSESVYASAKYSDLMHNFKSPTLDFSLEYGLGTGQISSSGVLETSTHMVLMSPSNNLKNQQVDHHQYEQQADGQNNGHGISTGYWTEMFGDGGRSDW